MNEFDYNNKLKKFNWGAFLLGWIWGIFNKSWITLIQIPISILPLPSLIYNFINIGIMIWFGIKGNSWALHNKKFNSYEHFVKYQKRLTIVGLTLQTLFIVLKQIYISFNTLYTPTDFNPITIKTQLFMMISITLFIYLLILIFVLVHKDKDLKN